jgi:hypothetical protein
MLLARVGLGLSGVTGGFEITEDYFVNSPYLNPKRRRNLR